MEQNVIDANAVSISEAKSDRTIGELYFRLLAVQVSYALDMLGLLNGSVGSSDADHLMGDVVARILEIINDCNGEGADDVVFPSWSLASLESEVAGIFSSIAALDDKIRRYLAEGWSINRLPRVVLAVLRVACYEISRGVSERGFVISSYLTVAKSLGHKDDIPFINGIIDKF